MGAHFPGPTESLDLAPFALLKIEHPDIVEEVELVLPAVDDDAFEGLEEGHRVAASFDGGDSLGRERLPLKWIMINLQHSDFIAAFPILPLPAKNEHTFFW